MAFAISCAVGPRPYLCVARLAGILFMADHAALAIPCGHDPVCFQPPHVIMRHGHHDTVALSTRILCMAHATGLIILAPKHAVPLHPKVIVVSRFTLTIHIDMAHQAILLCVVRIIADSHNVLAAQLRHGSQVLDQHFSVAIFAFIR